MKKIKDMRFCGTRLFLFLLFSFFIIHSSFAKGKAEEAEVKIQNNEWVLCVTEFDVSSVPPDKLGVASVITRRVVERLSLINYRTRISPEYAYYEGMEWARARNSAAKSLMTKQEERAGMLFRGDPAWKYRENIAKVDADIEKLRLTLEEIENNAPLINNEPVFKLSSGNMSSQYPSPPKRKDEYKFCTNQKADAFLKGTIYDFHGRFLITLELYTVYTRSYAWEDSVIFSADDLDRALDEITGRLIEVLSGNKPAGLIVKTNPPDALVLINQSFTARGSTEVIEQSPGTYTITAIAEDHESLTIETELFGGETAEVEFVLKPILYGNVEITQAVPMNSSLSVFPGTGSVYHGALYAGETPLTLSLPVKTMDYAELIMPGGETGAIVFEVPDMPNGNFSLSVRTAVPPPKGQVARARKFYYFAWGATWVTGIAAWIIYHTYTGMDWAVRYHYAQTEETNMGFYNSYSNMYNASMVFNITVSVTAAYGFFQIGRYLIASNRSTSPALRTVKK